MNAGKSRGSSTPKGANQEIGVPRWYSRGYLPHLEDAVIQHVTFHLADSLPQSALPQVERELQALPAGKRDAERRERIEAWIDAGHGCCLLREARLADTAQKALLLFDGQRYRLLEWVVMPNHVHVLFEPVAGWTAAKIVASWKKFTARKICDHRRNRGQPPLMPVWHREYWDRYIRDQRHLQKAIEYIHMNPVKAGLVVKPEDWRWSSAHFLGTPIP